MNVFELVEALDGEIVNNKAKVRVDGEFVVVGRVMGDEMCFTEDGEQIAAGMGDKESAKKKKDAE